MAFILVTLICQFLARSLHWQRTHAHDAR